MLSKKSIKSWIKDFFFSWSKNKPKIQLLWDKIHNILKNGPNCDRSERVTIIEDNTFITSPKARSSLFALLPSLCQLKNLTCEHVFHFWNNRGAMRWIKVKTSSPRYLPNGLHKACFHRNSPKWGKVISQTRIFLFFWFLYYLMEFLQKKMQIHCPDHSRPKFGILDIKKANNTEIIYFYFSRDKFYGPDWYTTIYLVFFHFPFSIFLFYAHD